MEAGNQTPKPAGKWQKRGALLILAILWLVVYYMIAPQHFDYLVGKIQGASGAAVPPGVLPGAPQIPPLDNPPRTWLPPRAQTLPPTTQAAPVRGKDNLFRLPKTVEPIHYDLTLKANILGYGYTPTFPPVNSTFEGNVTIQFKIVKPTRIILLNAEDLHIEQLELSAGSPNGPEIVKYTVYQNYIAIELTSKAKRDAIFRIAIRYSAQIRKDNKGFYDTTYLDAENRPKSAVVTQFEPDFARLAVPCFDEPEFKAVWKVKIIHPLGTSAISNAEQIKVSPFSEQFQISEFEETPKMSTYLLAFFISDFKYLEGVTQSGIRVRIWSRPEDVANHQLALESSIGILDNFEKLFDIPYAMRKMDMVGVRDFHFGAMENWGLIVYREAVLSYHPQMNTHAEKANIRRIISHELVHQWFGNLVTMKYWDQTWLNEGFATLYQVYGADLLTNGTYKNRDFLIHPGQRKALEMETKKPKHAMSFEILKTDTIQTFFDVVTYQKAGSIISMFRRVLGENEFLHGIRRYLKAHMYQNTQEEQLFKYIGASFAGGAEEFESFAKSWTNSEGFPTVNARIVENNQVELSQNDPEGLWEIPVFYQNGPQEAELIWLKDEPVTIPYTPGSLLILNPDSHGHFRVDYQSVELWEQIASQLEQNPRMLSARTKIRLIDDAFHFRRPEAEALRKYIFRETERLPILAYLLNLKGHDEELRSVLRGLQQVETSWKFVEMNYLEDSKFDEVDLATQIISTECMVNPTECYEKSEPFYEHLLKSCQYPGVQVSNCSKVPPPLRKTVYCAAILNQKHTELLESWMKNERRASEKQTLKLAFENCKPKANNLERKSRKKAGLDLAWNLEVEQQLYLEH